LESIDDAGDAVFDQISAYRGVALVGGWARIAPRSQNPLTDEHYGFRKPANPVERDWSVSSVRTIWLLGRLDRVQDETWQDQ
jgi:hypothetical protein